MQTAEASASVVEHGSIHAQLRQATAAHHQRLDRGLGYVLSDRCSVDRYVDLLAALFGFYVPLEDHLSVWAARVGALPLIRRAGLLERDLGVFGRGHDQIATNAEMPTWTSVDHVAGAIYVVEGACLGGQLSAREVLDEWKARGRGRYHELRP